MVDKRNESSTSSRSYCDRAFEPKLLIEQLQKLVHKEEIYRIKGFVDVPDKSMRLVFIGRNLTNESLDMIYK